MAALVPIEISSVLLRKLHRIYQQHADLESQLRRGPAQAKAVQALVDQASQKVEEITALLKKTRMTAHEKQLQLLTRENHVTSLKAKLNVAASNREYTLLSEQIAADQQANLVQNDEIFEVLERIDAIEADLSAAKDQLVAARDEQVKRNQEIEARMVLVAEEVDRVQKQREAAEGEIPLAAKQDFLRIVAARGEDSLAPIEADACGGCSQTLTTQLLSQVMLGHLVHCPNCNAFLYTAEDSRVR